jgi:hypothetical protein
MFPSKYFNSKLITNTIILLIMPLTCIFFCNNGFEIDLDYLKDINLNFKGKKIKVDAP